MARLPITATTLLIALSLLAPTWVLGATTLDTVSYSTDLAATLGGTVVDDEDVATDNLSGSVLPLGLGPLPADADVDAYHQLGNGDRLISFDVTVALPGGLTVDPADVVRYDGGTYSLKFDASDRGIGLNVNLDALAIDASGDLLMSFDIPEVFGGVFADDRDVLRFDGLGFTLFFNGSATGVSAHLDLDALHRLPNGRLLVSFDHGGRLDAVDFEDEDVLELDPLLGTWEMAVDGSALHAGWRAADLDALAAVGADSDGDGLRDTSDPCPGDPDNDGDGDGLCADVDNCPTESNASQADNDGDGAGDPCDCDDDDPTSFPGGFEVCDGADNDCDGTPDDPFDVGASCSVGVGTCAVTGATVCSAGGDEIVTLDIFPGTGSSSAGTSWSTTSGGLALFAADDGSGKGVELWRSDGSAVGTLMLKDINELGDSSPEFFFDLGGDVFFSAYSADLPDEINGGPGLSLWRLDAGGVEHVAVIDPNATDTSPSAVPVAGVGSLLLFLADADESSGSPDSAWELWRSSGDEPGTYEITNELVADPAAVGNPSETAVTDGGILLIRAGIILWRSDGSVSGTFPLLAAEPRAGTLEAFGGDVFFGGVPEDTGLWKTDGTSVENIRDDLTPAALEAVAGTLFFHHDGSSDCCTANGGPACDTQSCVDPVCTIDSGCCTTWDSDCATEAATTCSTLCGDAGLWKSDGTPGGTELVRRFSGTLASLTAVGSTLFFVADDPLTGRELWKSDGTESGTVRVRNITPGLGSSFSAAVGAGQLTAVGSTLYFVPDLRPTEVWRSDGSETGTYRIAEFPDGVCDPHNLVDVGGRLMFVAGDVTNGCEPRVAVNQTECTAIAGSSTLEICADGLDTNCDGYVDEFDSDDAEQWFPDTDGDGFGDQDTPLDETILACEQPAGFVANSLDVNDDKAFCTIDDTVLQVDPADGATQVSLSATIDVEFCKPVNPATVSAATVLVEDCASVPVTPGVDYDGDGSAEEDGISVSEDGTIVTFNPLEALLPSTWYTVVLTNSLKYADGFDVNFTDTIFRTATDATDGTASADDIGDGVAGSAIDGLIPGEAFGRSEACVGDVNGDGIDEFIVGAPQADVGGMDSGNAYLLFGDVGLQDGGDSPNVRFVGEAAGDQAGFRVATAGDVNLDGTADFLVGAPGHDPGGMESAGAVYVVFGGDHLTPGSSFDLGALGTSAFPGLKIVGQTDGEWVGFSLDGGLDVDRVATDTGPLTADILIGAPGADLGADVDAGRAYLVFGPLTSSASPLSLSDLGMPDSPGVTYEGVAAGDLAGWSVAFWPDTGAGGGDGLHDFLVGSPGSNTTCSATPYTDGGQVFVIHGHPSNFLSSTVTLDEVGTGSLADVSGGVHSGCEDGGSLGLVVDGADVVWGGEVAGTWIAGKTCEFEVYPSAARSLPGTTLTIDQTFDKTVARVQDSLTAAPFGVVIEKPTSTNCTGLGPSAPVASVGMTFNDPQNLDMGMITGFIGDDDDNPGESLAVGTPRDGVGGKVAVLPDDVWIAGTKIDLDEVGTNVPGLVFEGTDANGLFGASVAGGGDVDADALPDLLLGAPAEPASGVSYVVSLGAPAGVGSFLFIQPRNVPATAGGSGGGFLGSDGIPAITTGFEVQAGETLRIEATGSVIIDASKPATGPDGFDFFEQAAASFLLEDAAAPGGEASAVAGALIARIGGGAYFFVGSSAEIVAAATGEVELAVNDIVGSFADNTGSFEATVETTIPGVDEVVIDTPSGRLTSVPLQFATADQLLWGDSDLATGFNVYRGQIDDLRADGQVFTSSTLCLAIGLQETSYSDPNVPTAGDTFYYLVSGRNDTGEGGLGVEDFLQQLADLGLVSQSVVDGLVPRVNNAPCSTAPVPTFPNQDGDTWNDFCDNCPTITNETQDDLDADGAGDACDPDIDGDGVLNDVDACPTIPDPCP